MFPNLVTFLMRSMINKTNKMNKAISAGGLVVRNNPDKQILLIKFPDNNGLGFPKGHVEKGETVEQAAIREVFEETGLSGLKIIKRLGIVTRPAVEDDGTEVQKDIHLFLMKTDSNSHSEADQDYGWFGIDEAIQKMGFPQEAEFLRKIKEYLK